MLKLQTTDNIANINKNDWQKLLGDNPHPFIQYDFLNALEISGSVGEESGWLPHHFMLYDDDKLMGIVPNYIKHHSYGEYIFDHNLAHSYYNLGMNYYPKLLSAVPFTPITGQRIIADQQYYDAIIKTLRDDAKNSDYSSLNFNFIDEDTAKITQQNHFHLRHTHQYHWYNHHYQDFDGFLAQLSSRKRKNIKKERQYLSDQGVSHEIVTGDALTSDIWDIFFQLYKSTYDRKWGAPYLTRDFFDMISQTMKDQIILVIGKFNGQILSAALNFIDDTAIYGRNWGCAVRLKNLHFETCYYQAIDYAINHQLERVEAGTQGEQKLQRGYQPVTTYSAHYLYHSDMHRAYGDYLKSERKHNDKTIAYLDKFLPFKQAEQ